MPDSFEFFRLFIHPWRCLSDLSGVLNPPTYDTKLGWELVERRGRGHRSDQVVGGSGAGLQTVISLEKVVSIRSMNINSNIKS